ncbi:MAG: hypothetical protein LAQ30_01565 [Acidobacteriia bacterium]|nr:hypothetical protein [Terriglobia bacterium]
MFADLAKAIFRQEGSMNADGSWNTAALGFRLNNPGNLNYAGQPGATSVTLWDPVAKANVTYAQFDTLENGVAATERQLSLDAGRGLTLAQRLSTWATGNRAAYIANVSSWLGVDPNTPLYELASSPAGPSAPAGLPTLAWPAGDAEAQTGGDPPLDLIYAALALGAVSLAYIAFS